MWFRCGHKRKIIAACIGMLLMSTTAFAGGIESFNDGLKAYRTGNYQQAVTLFEKARSQGVRKVAVYFNLGSSYYRLGQYDKAIPMFKRVTRYPKMADVAHFNLGLIARKQKDNKRARLHFKETIATSKNKKLIYLAQKNIQEIDNRLGVWRGGAVAEAGYDDNVSNTATGIASGGDAYMTLRAYTGVLISGTQKKGWSIRGDLYNRSYAVFDTYSLGSFKGSIKRHMPLFGQQGYVGGFYKVITLGGAGYENILGLELGAKSRPKSGVHYRYHYQVESIGTAAAYDYLDGTRQRLQVERRKRLNKNSELRLRYRLEVNDRQNAVDLSYSNTRHGLRATYIKRTNPKTRWRYGLRYRLSDYVPVGVQNRDDSLIQASVRRTRKLKNGLEWTAQYSLSQNDSSESTYTYTSNVYQVGIRKQF